MMKRVLFLVCTATLIAGACGKSSKSTATSAVSSSTSTTNAAFTVGVRTDAKLGPILVDGSGMTLYKNIHDKPGTFACTGTCLSTWPPLTVTTGGTPTAAPGLPGTLATTTRPDGTVQVTYNGTPLYRYASDTTPGDTNGQRIAGVWFVVNPTAAVAGTPTTGRATTATTVSHAATTRAPTPAATTPTTSSPMSSY